MNKIVKGSVVKLRSGGPEMTVACIVKETLIPDADIMQKLNNPYYCCQWFTDKNELQKDKFYLEQLEFIR
jgi:Uncharacterized small protein (DUF2158).